MGVEATKIKVIKKDVKHINIRVKPNCDVILTAPINTKETNITYVLKKRTGWIDKKIAFYKKYQGVVPKEYVGGKNFC